CGNPSPRPPARGGPRCGVPSSRWPPSPPRSRVWAHGRRLRRGSAPPRPRVGGPAPPRRGGGPARAGAAPGPGGPCGAGGGLVGAAVFVGLIVFEARVPAPVAALREAPVLAAAPAAWLVVKLLRREARSAR